MIVRYLQARILHYYMFDLIKPSCRTLEPFKSLLIDNIGLEATQELIDRIVQLKSEQLDPHMVLGKTTFIEQCRCMICDTLFNTSSELASLVVLSPTMNQRREIIYCSSCSEIAHYSYLNGYLSNNIMIQSDLKIWNPFDEKGIFSNIDYKYQGIPVQAVLTRIPFFNHFEDDPISKIYMIVTFSYLDPDDENQPLNVRRATSLLELIQNDPKLLSKFKNGPMDFQPHLFFPKDLNQKIQAYLAQVRSSIVSL